MNDNNSTVYVRVFLDAESKKSAEKLQPKTISKESNRVMNILNKNKFKKHYGDIKNET